MIPCISVFLYHVSSLNKDFFKHLNNNNNINWTKIYFNLINIRYFILLILLTRCLKHSLCRQNIRDTQHFATQIFIGIFNFPKQINKNNNDFFCIYIILYWAIVYFLIYVYRYIYVSKAWRILLCILWLVQRCIFYKLVSKYLYVAYLWLCISVAFSRD